MKREKRPGDVILEALYGRKMPENLDYCVKCETTQVKDENFRDETARREYKISCLCQECQDIAFAEPED